jgi:hypothetical protein
VVSSSGFVAGDGMCLFLPTDMYRPRNRIEWSTDHKLAINISVP